MGQTAFRVLVLEIAAEIAAPHQYEGPHLAAGHWARSSADRSGARGKRTCQPGRDRCGEVANRIPKRRDSDMVRSHSPHPQLSAGSEVLSRLPFGAPKNGAVLTGPRSPRRTKHPGKGEWELWKPLLQIQLDGPCASRWSAAKYRRQGGVFNTLPLTKDGVLIEDAEGAENFLFDRGWLNKSEAVAGACCDHAIGVMVQCGSKPNTARQRFSSPPAVIGAFCADVLPGSFYKPFTGLLHRSDQFPPRISQV